MRSDALSRLPTGCRSNVPISLLMLHRPCSYATAKPVSGGRPASLHPPADGLTLRQQRRLPYAITNCNVTPYTNQATSQSSDRRPSNRASSSVTPCCWRTYARGGGPKRLLSRFVGTVNPSPHPPAHTLPSGKPSIPIPSEALILFLSGLCRDAPPGPICLSRSIWRLLEALGG